MVEEKQEESIWKFYFKARWQTALTTLFLLITIYLSLFYIGNVWNAIQFAFYTFISSADMLGLTFALWGVIFIVSAVIPFLQSFYAIFLLPKIWRSSLGLYKKSMLTALMIILIPLIVIITNTLAQIALDTDVLREFVNFHNIVS